MVEMLAKKRFTDFPQRFVDGRNLSEDIDAVAFLVDHALDPADLTFDAAEAIDDLLPFRLVETSDRAMWVFAHAYVNIPYRGILFPRAPRI